MMNIMIIYGYLWIWYGRRWIFYDRAHVGDEAPDAGVGHRGSCVVVFENGHLRWMEVGRFWAVFGAENWRRSQSQMARLVLLWVSEIH